MFVCREIIIKHLYYLKWQEKVNFVDGGGGSGLSALLHLNMRIIFLSETTVGKTSKVCRAFAIGECFFASHFSFSDS